MNSINTNRTQRANDVCKVIIRTIPAGDVCYIIHELFCWLTWWIFFYPLHRVLLYLFGFFIFQLVISWSHFYFWSHFSDLLFWIHFIFFSVICLSKFDSISSCFHYIWVFLFILRYWGVLWTLGWCSSFPNVWSSNRARRAPRSVTRCQIYDRFRAVFL